MPIDPVRVPVIRLSHGTGLDLPAYKTAESAGMDLLAAVPSGEPLVLSPMGRVLIPTGLAFALPPGYEAQVRPRSGLAVERGITILNSPGTVDSDYRGEVKVALINLGQRDVAVHRGMRIAQLVVAPVTRARWEPVESLEETVRGTGGFGSTGTD
ncbi:dUTP diphosphatase [Yunchengibacter salinarum]|uniref:dUTP diphosphatase n=1 Tax=Yunchengibacter salinarum TaxID=3133399 RepID=UPI0035B5BE92